MFLSSSSCSFPSTLIGRPAQICFTFVSLTFSSWCVSPLSLSVHRLTLCTIILMLSSMCLFAHSSVIWTWFLGFWISLYLSDLFASRWTYTVPATELYLSWNSVTMHLGPSFPQFWYTFVTGTMTHINFISGKVLMQASSSNWWYLLFCCSDVSFFLSVPSPVSLVELLYQCSVLFFSFYLIFNLNPSITIKSFCQRSSYNMKDYSKIRLFISHQSDCSELSFRDGQFQTCAAYILHASLFMKIWHFNHVRHGRQASSWQPSL